MSRMCEITGKAVMFGNNVSHSNAKTKRKFIPNLQTKKFYSEKDKNWVVLKVSAAGIRNINKNGLDASLATAREKGYYK